MERIDGMKVLSITMPWAWFIMKFGKDVENRTWRTNYRGRILIHASKKPEPSLCDIVFQYRAALSLENPTLRRVEIDKMLERCGCIIGSVELVDCVQDSKSPWAERGLWHWVLKNPVLFDKPIPARGSLGLWEYKG